MAYSAVSEYDKLTFEKVSVVHRAHCLCPADHILAANSSKPGFEQELEGSLLFGTEMLCTKVIYFLSVLFGALILTNFVFSPLFVHHHHLP